MLRLILVVLLTLNLPLHALAKEPKQVQILTLVHEANSPLKVNLTTDGDMARSFIPIGGFFTNAASANRNKKYAQSLTDAIGEFDRLAVIQQSIESVIEDNYPVFDVVFPKVSQDFFKGKKFNYKKAKGYRYVLSITEVFSGLSMTTIATKTDSVAVMSGVKWELYDIKKKKRLKKGRMYANSLDVMSIREAIDNPEFFTDNYPSVVIKELSFSIGELYRANILNQMAKTVGRGKEVLPFGDVLKPYEKRFKYRFTPPKGWKNTKMNSKFVHVIEPKNDDRMKMGVHFGLDLLISELGQDVGKVSDYIPVMLNRLEAAQYDVSTFKSVQGPVLSRRYEAYEISRPGGQGKELYLIRLVDDTFLEVFTLVFVADADRLYQMYEKDIISIIDGRKLTINPKKN